MDLIRRTSRTFASLVIAIVFACGLVHLLGMLLVYGFLLIGGEPMPINPGILAGSFWVGAMQGVSVLLVAIPLGALSHIVLMRSGGTALLPYVLAGLVLAGASTVFLGVTNGFAFNAAYAVMAVTSGALGGCLFWLIRRPDRDAIASQLPEHPTR